MMQDNDIWKERAQYRIGKDARGGGIYICKALPFYLFGRKLGEG